MKKFLLCVMIVMMSVAAEGYGTFSGKWNIYGEGFAEKGFVRTQLELNGDMNVSACSFLDLPADVVNVMSDDWETVISRDEIGGLYTFFDCLTGMSMNFSVYASSLGMKVYEENNPNEITDPYLFLDIIPSLSEPLEFPDLKVGSMTIQLTLTSESAGKLWMRGNVNTSSLGEIEINTECVIWKDGTERPSLSGGGKSGCDSGMNIFALMILLLGVRKFVRN